MERIYYSGPLHDEAEVEAVCKVLRGGPAALKLGANVAAMEEAVAEAFACGLLRQPAGITRPTGETAAMETSLQPASHSDSVIATAGPRSVRCCAARA